jgi:hypothetical protein
MDDPMAMMPTIDVLILPWVRGDHTCIPPRLQPSKAWMACQQA